MKKFLLIATIASFVIVSCNNSQSGTHTHDDGSTHTDCDHDQDSAEHPSQETFEVETDSSYDCKHDSTAKEGEHVHTHEDGSEHTH